MKVREIASRKPQFSNEIPIGMEIDVMDKRSLILGAVKEEVRWQDGTGQKSEMLNKIFMLHEAAPEDADDWDEEEDWDEEPVTNRQELIEAAADMGPEVSDIETFHINGRRYEVNENESFFMEEQEYESVVLIQYFLEQNCIPRSWQEKELDGLVLSAYEMNDDIWDINWQADILNISVEMEKLIEEVLVGRIMKCAVGRYDVPKSLALKGKQGRAIEVKIHGLLLNNIWESMNDPLKVADASTLSVSPDERLLVLEYESPEDIELEFYTKDYLDAEADGLEPELFFDDIAIDLLDSERPAERTWRVLDVVSSDFNDDVEIELLSYSVIES